MITYYIIKLSILMHQCVSSIFTSVAGRCVLVVGSVQSSGSQAGGRSPPKGHMRNLRGREMIRLYVILFNKKLLIRENKSL